MAKLNSKIIKESLKKYWWVIAIALLIKFTQPDLTAQLTTQSILGGFLGFGVSLSTIMFIIGLFLIFIPEPTTTVLGIILSVIAIALGGGSILTAIGSIFGSFSTPIMVLIFVGLGYIIFKKIL